MSSALPRAARSAASRTSATPPSSGSAASSRSAIASAVLCWRSRTSRSSPEGRRAWARPRPARCRWLLRDGPGRQGARAARDRARACGECRSVCRPALRPRGERSRREPARSEASEAGRGRRPRSRAESAARGVGDRVRTPGGSVAKLTDARRALRRRERPPLVVGGCLLLGSAVLMDQERKRRGRSPAAAAGRGSLPWREPDPRRARGLRASPRVPLAVPDRGSRRGRARRCPR